MWVGGPKKANMFLSVIFSFLYLCFKCCHWVQGPGEGDVNMKFITNLFEGFLLFLVQRVLGLSGSMAVEATQLRAVKVKNLCC